MAGIIPGILLTTLFMSYIYIACKRNPALGPPGEPATMKEKLGALKGVIGMLLLIILILGGILSGLFSPTEGGCRRCLWCFPFCPGQKKH
ncbi:MAG: TRAP transporter large permease subunit [Dehalobacterium sp.]